MTGKTASVDLQRTRVPLFAEYRAVCGDIEPRAALNEHWPLHFGRAFDPKLDGDTEHARLHEGLAGCRRCAIALAALWVESLGKPHPAAERFRKLRQLQLAVEQARQLTTELDPKSPHIEALERLAADVAKVDVNLPNRERFAKELLGPRAGRPALSDLGCAEFILHQGGYPLRRIAELIVDEGGDNPERLGRTEKRIKRYRESLTRQNAETILSGESQEGTPLPS